jgi:hypothetical protein
VRQSPENRRYALGSGLFELGMAAPNPITQFPQVRSVAEELAASTEDTVYLMLRSYDDVLCAWRAQGAYPIKANVVALGDRRPMGASVAGLCLLAGLPEAESDALIAANGPYLPAFCRMTPADVARHVNDARDKGLFGGGECGDGGRHGGGHGGAGKLPAAVYGAERVGDFLAHPAGTHSGARGAAQAQRGQDCRHHGQRLGRALEPNQSLKLPTPNRPTSPMTIR